MVIRDDTSTRFRDEIRIISRWAWLAAAVGFLAVMGLMASSNYGCRRTAGLNGVNWTCTILGTAPPDAVQPPRAVMVPLGIAAGVLVACLIVLIGYVNGDAGRRGMNRVLWTLLATFIPNGIGILLYFLLRKPRISTCPQCSAPVEPGFGFCPQCRYSLGASCPQCRRGVNAGGRFCPYCSAEIGSAINV